MAFVAQRSIFNLSSNISRLTSAGLSKLHFFSSSSKPESLPVVRRWTSKPQLFPHFAHACGLRGRAFSTEVVLRRRFKNSGPVDAKENFIVDRASWHRELAEFLRQGRCMLLHGHRQDGKSSAAGCVATLLETGPGRKVALSVTFEGLSTRTVEGAWAAFEMLVRGSVKSLADRMRSRGLSLPTAVERAHEGLPLFVDVASFQLFWGRQEWDNYGVTLIIDEFDALLSVPVAVRASILAGLRATRTLHGITAAGPILGGSAFRSLPTVALESMLAIGVYRVLQLSAGTDQSVSPFNVADAVRPPLASLSGLSAMILEYDSENGVTTSPEVVRDIAWRCGGHVGLASFLCCALSGLRNQPGYPGPPGVNPPEWWALMSSPELLKSLQESSTVQSMLRCVDLGQDSTRVTISARALVRSLLIVPSWHAVPLATVNFDAAATLLLSEGVIVQVSSAAADAASKFVEESSSVGADSEHVVSQASPTGSTESSMSSSLPTQSFRISAPLLAQQLLLTVGSFSAFYSSALASLRFSTLSPTDNRINLVKTVVECFPYFDGKGLSHPLGLLQDKTPCDYAFHTPLYTILRARGNSQNVCVIFEARDPGRKKLRRLDIALVDGTRAGIELLVSSKDLEAHVEEQAPTYAREQRLANVLVVNFCSTLDTLNLDYRVPAALVSQNVDLMHVLYDSAARTLTPYAFDPICGAFSASIPVALLDCSKATPGSETLQTYEEAAVAKAEASRALFASEAAADVAALTARAELAEASTAELKARLDALTAKPTLGSGSGTGAPQALANVPRQRVELFLPHSFRAVRRGGRGGRWRKGLRR